MLTPILHSLSGEINEKVNTGLRNNVFEIEFSGGKLSEQSSYIKTIIERNSDLVLQYREQGFDQYTDIQSSLKYFVKTVNGIPDRVQSDVQEYRTPFISYRFQTNRVSFDTLTISFIDPLGTPIKQFFKYYIYKYIINPYYNVIQKQENYKFMITIKHYSNIVSVIKREQEIKVKKYVFYGVFPITINGIQLQTDSTDTIQTDITFQYDYWREFDETSTVMNIEQTGLITSGGTSGEISGGEGIPSRISM